MSAVRYGRVNVKANKTDPQYTNYLVKEDDGWVGYYHGGPTCNTSDGWVTLPEEWLSRVRWDKPAVYTPEDES